jgi:N-sulfoglucosamine sulfohydrolase
LTCETDTLVLFTSEQGSQFPGCKWTNWDTGVHTALLARWPGVVAPGTRTDALVQYADIAPTLIEAAGGDPSEWTLDGSSFLNVLRGDQQQHRQYVYGMHNNFPEGPPYPIRSITDGEYHYIRNLTPDEIYIEKHLMGSNGNGELNNPYWSTWIWAASTDPKTYALTKRYTRRPAEQLYHLTEDRYEMVNLADDTTYAPIKQRLSRELEQWMSGQGDPGIEQDTPQSQQAAKRGGHRFVPPQ